MRARHRKVMVVSTLLLIACIAVADMASVEGFRRWWLARGGTTRDLTYSFTSRALTAVFFFPLVVIGHGHLITWAFACVVIWFNFFRPQVAESE